MIASMFSSTFPEEASETEKKVAAAQAAQVTATTAQIVADEYKKVANAAIEADRSPEEERVHLNIREQAEDLIKATIQSLRKLNIPKE